MNIYIIWLIGVVIWNFGVPKASPLEDVIVAVILSLLFTTRRALDSDLATVLKGE